MNHLGKLGKTIAMILAGAAFMACPAPTLGASIVNSKHNLSASGPGSIKALSESRVCVFCHTPHSAQPRNYLWNRDEPAVTYNPYESSTMRASVGQPSGASKLCLSCHDGTIALGMLRSERKPIPMAGGLTSLPHGRGRLGTDLSDDHPISFQYDLPLLTQNKELANPAGLRGTVRLEEGRLLQCTSCHDPHNDQYGKFLVIENAYSALCTTCHQISDWNVSSHATSTRSWNGAGVDPWPHTDYGRVDENGCENCHRPHSAGYGPRLLNARAEEDNCLPCHEGNVAQHNIGAELSKPYTHPVGATMGAHDPTEDLATVDRHVECVDCHNPHAVRSGGTSPPLVSGLMKGVSGVGSSGNMVEEAQYEYQICYKCHGFWSDNPPVNIQTTLREVPRQFPQNNNVRRQFSTSNLSFHPVEAPGRNANVPSLSSPLTANSLIYCTDCHNNDSGPGAGGIAPRGPHGSNNPFLLERRLETQDVTNESPAAYALCYKCHERQSVLSDQSFKEHKKHVVEERTPCTVCHDPHGVAGQTKLINFDLRAVSASRSGVIRFDDLGARKGRCYLKCHDKEHDPLEY